MDKTEFELKIREFETEFEKSLKLFHAIVDEFGIGVANSLITGIRNQSKPIKPENWPNCDGQQRFGKNLDSLYQMIQPSRTVAGKFHWAFNVSSETEKRENNQESTDKIRGDKPKIGGLTQEIALIRIIEKFLEKLQTKHEYSVLHDQPLLKSATSNRWHDCDITIVRKQKKMKSSIGKHELRPLLMLELKSNLDWKKIRKFYSDVGETRKYWASKDKTSKDSLSPIIAAFVFREPDGNLLKLTRSSTNIGLRDLISEDDKNKYKFQWIEAIEKRLETRVDSNWNPKQIPAFLLPDGGGISNLFNIGNKHNLKEEDIETKIFESINNLPKRPWFGISALVHFILTAIVLDDGYIPLN